MQNNVSYLLDSTKPCIVPPSYAPNSLMLQKGYVLLASDYRCIIVIPKGLLFGGQLDRANLGREIR